ncbi:hypothetical protein Hanom_Chr07g00590951 [Helianthus anomalus]
MHFEKYDHDDEEGVDDDEGANEESVDDEEGALPRNIDEYLQLKVKQAEDILKRDTKGKSDKEIQRNLQYLLSQVRTLE